MSLTVGDRLGHYEVTAQIGVGGMGEVYRATGQGPAGVVTTGTIQYFGGQ